MTLRNESSSLLHCNGWCVQRAGGGGLRLTCMFILISDRGWNVFVTLIVDFNLLLPMTTRGDHWGLCCNVDGARARGWERGRARARGGKGQTDVSPWSHRGTFLSDRMPPVVGVNVVLEGQRCADELILGMSRGPWRQRARVHWCWSGTGGGQGGGGWWWRSGRMGFGVVELLALASRHCQFNRPELWTACWSTPSQMSHRVWECGCFLKSFLDNK